MDILHRVIIQKNTFKETSKAMRVSIDTVKMLMRKVKNNNDAMSEIYQEEDIKRQKCLAIKSTVEGLNERDEVIESSE